VIFGESGVDIEDLWEVIKLEVTDKEYPVETAFFFAWIKRNDPSNKAVAVFAQKVEKEDAIDRLMQVCNGFITKSDIKWKTEEATAAGHYSEKDYKGRGKKTPCKFFQVGRCRKGDSCPYLHVVDEGGFDEGGN
jgi:hypothetical protein